MQWSLNKIIYQQLTGFEVAMQWSLNKIILPQLTGFEVAMQWLLCEIIPPQLTGFEMAMWWPLILVCPADLSKVSISDLENIQETDTPPQSPSSSKQEAEDTATVHVKSPPSASAVHYLKVCVWGWGGGERETKEKDRRWGGNFAGVGVGGGLCVWGGCVLGGLHVYECVCVWGGGDCVFKFVLEEIPKERLGMSDV